MLGLVVFVALVLVVALIVIGRHSSSIADLPIEPMPDEGIDDRTIKEEFFDMCYKLVYVIEEDGTEAIEVRDRKTHLIVAYTTGDGLRLVKQAQGGK